MARHIFPFFTLALLARLEHLDLIRYPAFLADIAYNAVVRCIIN